MSECAKCKNDSAENTYRYAIVAVSTSTSTDHYVVAKKTTTTVYEKLVSVERSCMCNSCIKKERVMYVLRWTGFIALFIFAALAFAAIRTRTFGIGYLIALAIGSLIGFIGVFFYSRSRKDAFYASDIRSAIASKKSDVKYRFVPVDSELYCAKGNKTPDIKTFKEKSGLRTTVADTVFEKFISSGNGSEMVDSLLADKAQD